jgi:hypothetical protein
MPHTYTSRRGSRVLAGAAAIGLGLLACAACARPGGLTSGGTPPGGSATGSGVSSTSMGHPTATPSSRSDVSNCTAADLAFVGSSSGGAMGSLITTYSVVNQSTTGCVLQGSPHLKYVAANGSVADVQTNNTAGGDQVSVDPGATAQFDVRTVNGFGGYEPSNPACAHPATYSAISAVLADGSTVSLGGSQISVQCGDIEVNDWHRPGA